MKKLIVLIVLLASLVFADNNLYQYDTLDLRLEVEGGFTLEAPRENAKISEARADLFLYPSEDFRQKIISLETEGRAFDEKISFVWNFPKIASYKFGYASLIRTNNARLKVKQKIPFPITSVTGYEDYLLPTATIDSHNPDIIAKAAELAEGEDDLFKVAFKLASWVEQNVKYDLNTLTATASQKASWVLENKEGVCDEMTSLFVAMARSLGIPARFVSGISYTTSDLFTENWQPHGWAEVYFPDIGWVPFDITFGEYGYVDVTHIKLRDGFDPAEPATTYQWLAEDVTLRAKDLDLNVNIIKKGKQVPEEIRLDLEILAPEVGFGSYNLIKGIVKNTADYYVATTLQLAVPKEVNIEGKNKRTILLGPKEIKETTWIIFLSDVDTDYRYTFPAVIYSERNTSIQDAFYLESGKSYYRRDEIEQLSVRDEEKTYSRKVSLTCTYQKELVLDKEAEVQCSLKNVGNSNLDGVRFCIGDVCETLDLPINQLKRSSIQVQEKKPGWRKMIVTAENKDIEKKLSVEYVVWDEPQLTVDIAVPEKVPYGEQVPISLTLSKSSFRTPQDVQVYLTSPGFEYHWEVSEIKDRETVEAVLPSERMAATTKINVRTVWKEDYSQTQEAQINIVPGRFLDRIKLWLNAVVNVFA